MAKAFQASQSLRVAIFRFEDNPPLQSLDKTALSRHTELRREVCPDGRYCPQLVIHKQLTGMFSYHELHELHEFSLAIMGVANSSAMPQAQAERVIRAIRG